MSKVIFSRPRPAHQKDSATRTPLPLPLKGRGSRGVDSGVAKPEEKEEKPDLDYVLECVDRLTESEQRQVLAHLALRNQKALAGKSSRDVDMWATAVYDALVASFGRMDGAVQAPLVVKGLVGAHKTWAPVDGFMSASGFSGLKVAERQAAYRFLAEMVLREAKSISGRTGVPVSTKFYANVATNIAAIFEAEFPGYLRSGLAPIVAKRLIGAQLA